MATAMPYCHERLPLSVKTDVLFSSTTRSYTKRYAPLLYLWLGRFTMLLTPIYTWTWGRLGEDFVLFFLF